MYIREREEGGNSKYNQIITITMIAINTAGQFSQSLAQYIPSNK